MGSSGRLYFFVTTVLAFGAFLLLLHFATSKELHREVACYKERLRINCGNHSFIAIHEAYFSATEVQENLTCPLPTLENEYIEDEAEESNRSSGCYDDLRISINRKCSGSKSCNYSYFEDRGKKCPNQGGLFVIRYDCVRDTSAIKYCNIKVHAREGYIASPGFPQFYPKLENCNWTLDASDGQTILAKVLHLHLRAPAEVFPSVSEYDSLYAMGILSPMTSEPLTKCEDDSLTIMEGNVKRTVLCGENVRSLQTVEAEASKGMMVKFRSASFLPASGFLMYFKIEGCPTMAASEGSSLVERNGSASMYVCHDDRVFNDTLENSRFLSCVRDHHWNDTLPPCVALEEMTTSAVVLNSTTEHEVENITFSTQERTTEGVVRKEAAFLEDIIIPSVLIVVLIIGNAVIVAVILVIRRRHKSNLDEEEENASQPQPQPLVSEIKDV